MARALTSGDDQARPIEMSDLLRSMTGGIARFALAWLLPTSVAVGLFWGFCVPALESVDSLNALTGGGGKREPLEALGVAAFAAFAIAITLAYASQLVYRILEGYHLPASIGRVLTARQMRRRERLQATVTALGRSHVGITSSAYGLALEQLELYPPRGQPVLGTRLGNALLALERYGLETYGIDSQQFWFELVGTAEVSVRTEVDEMRALVDLFVAAVAAFSLLSVSSLAVALVVDDRVAPLALAGAAALLVPIAYRGAVRNMKDWRNSVRAMINLGRLPVAEGIGLVLPWKLEDERKMWQSASGVLHFRDPAHRPWLDVFRRGTPVSVVDQEFYVTSTDPRAHELAETLYPDAGN